MSNLPLQADDRVRAIAYALWLEEGQPHGRAEAHWFKAQELVNAEALAPALATVDTVDFPPKKKAPSAAKKAVSKVAAAVKTVAKKTAPTKKTKKD